MAARLNGSDVIHEKLLDSMEEILENDQEPAKKMRKLLFEAGEGIRKCTDSISAMEVQMADDQTTINDLKAQITELKEGQMKSSTEIDKLNGQCAQSKNEKDDLLKQIADLKQNKWKCNGCSEPLKIVMFCSECYEKFR